MPFVHLELFNVSPPADTVAALQQALSEQMATQLGKRRDLTVVAVSAATASASVGGRPLGPGEWTARLVAQVTAGTNTPEQKAAFLAHAHGLLTAHFGEPAAPLYIVVHEIAGDAWGYGGLSQAHRARPEAQAAR